MDKTVIITESEIFKQFFFSGDLYLIKALILLMAIDIVTGVLKAIVNQNLWSRKSLFGYARKLLVFCIIILSNIIDQIIHMDGALVTATIFFYIANEGFSIFENSVQLGLPVPNEVKEKLAVISENKTSITTEIKEEFTTKKTEFIGDNAEVNIKIEGSDNK